MLQAVVTMTASTAALWPETWLLRFNLLLSKHVMVSVRPQARLLHLRCSLLLVSTETSSLCMPIGDCMAGRQEAHTFIHDS